MRQEEINWISCSVAKPQNDKVVMIAYLLPWKFSGEGKLLRPHKLIVTVARFSGGLFRFLTPNQRSMKSDRVKYWAKIPTGPSYEDYIYDETKN
jgi:hypothetical protein